MSRIGDRGEMEAFVRSVELGSFSAAARELKLTPSTLSKLLTRLERSLKVRLVTRTTRSIKPTPEGELFFARCRRLLVEMEDAEMELSRSRDSPRGRLRLHSGVGFGASQLAKQLPRFLERYPEVQLDLRIQDGSFDIIRENVDISLSTSPLNPASVVVRKLFEFDRLTCASPAYLKRHGAPRSPEDLARHHCMRVSSVAARLPWRFRGPSGPRTFEFVPYLAVDNANFLYRFGVAGLGVVQMMEYIVAEALRDGRLVRILEDYHCPAELTMFAVYPQERHRLPRVRAMLDFLAETFGPRPWRHALRAAAGRKGKSRVAHR